jgi:putative FmdB family regulatory protein
MPTYQYRCQHCGHEFDEFQSITEPPLSACPRCGKKPQRIITGGIGFLLKGSGFYTTDYRSEAYKAAARKDGDSAGSPTKTSGDSTAKSKTDGPKSGPVKP